MCCYVYGDCDVAANSLILGLEVIENYGLYVGHPFYDSRYVGISRCSRTDAGQTERCQDL